MNMRHLFFYFSIGLMNNQTGNNDERINSFLTFPSFLFSSHESLLHPMISINMQLKERTKQIL